MCGAYQEVYPFFLENRQALSIHRPKFQNQEPAILLLWVDEYEVDLSFYFSQSNTDVGSLG